MGEWLSDQLSKYFGFFAFDAMEFSKIPAVVWLTVGLVMLFIFIRFVRALIDL